MKFEFHDSSCYPSHFKKIFKSHKIANPTSIFMKIICVCVCVCVGARAHTSGCRLKIMFLDVSDYFEYSDSTIWIFFSQKQFFQWGSKKSIFRSNILLCTKKMSVLITILADFIWIQERPNEEIINYWFFSASCKKNF